jgi:hypothetical protein
MSDASRWLDQAKNARVSQEQENDSVVVMVPIE